MPTSGVSPYSFTATFLNKDSFSIGRFAIFAYARTAEGSCPLPGFDGTSQEVMASSLLDTGSYLLTSGTVPAGSCRVYNLVIRDLSDNSIVSQSNVSVDNV